MKIRQGFVSNSSSSSFCIIGVVLDKEINWREIEGMLWNKRETNSNLEIFHGIEEYYDNCLLGVSVHSISEDKTIRQVKQEVLEVLDKIPQLKGRYILKNIEIHEDGGREG